MRENLHRPSCGEAPPPLPGKLVKKIEQGEVIELSDLLPERLSSEAMDEDGKPKRNPY